MEELAEITTNGTILLGRLLACDGHDYSRKHFVFSHIHSDHVDNNLWKCLHNGQVYTSKQTMELLEAITDDTFDNRTQFHTLDCNVKYSIEQDEKIEGLRLIESKHMLGAAQIEVVTSDRKKILYSGDISSEDQPPDNVNVLVVDSTHGTPQFETASDDSLGRRFQDIVSKQIKKNYKPVMIHANRGRLQELMSVISKENFGPYQLIAQKKDIAASKIYKNYDYPMRDMIEEKSEQGEEIRDSDDWPWIQFTTSFNPSTRERLEEQYGIYFFSYNSGYQMTEDENSAQFLEGSHANYSALIDYIEKAHPDTVIVDNFRTKQGEKLAHILVAKGFSVSCQPA